MSDQFGANRSLLSKIPNHHDGNASKVIVVVFFDLLEDVAETCKDVNWNIGDFIHNDQTDIINLVMLTEFDEFVDVEELEIVAKVAFVQRAK